MREADNGICQFIIGKDGQRCDFSNRRALIESWRAQGFSATDVKAMVCEASIPPSSRAKDCPTYKSFVEASQKRHY